MNYDIASGIVEEVTRHPWNFGLPPIIEAKIASGGVVHYVWELVTEAGRFYLKIRGDRFAKIPGITTSSENIVYEYKALILLSNLMPDNFPQVIYFEPERSLMIITDAIPNGVNFEILLRSRKATPRIIENLAMTLRGIHDVLRSTSEAIRKDEKTFFQDKLEHKLRCNNHPVLNNVIEDLTLYEPRQLIIGDPSPKNIGVNNLGESFIFFDLEDVHRGNLVFDIGFLIGHLILHTYPDERKAISYVKSFLHGYGGKSLKTQLIKAIALGTILYRLNSVIPYSLELPDHQSTTLSQEVRTALEISDLDSIEWHELIRMVLKEK